MRGFSLIEILIVTSVTLCIAATAIPKIVSTIATVELRSGTRSAAGILQLARSQSVKDAKFYQVKYKNASGGGIVYLDLKNDNNNDATDPQAQMGTTVLAYGSPSGIPAISSTLLGFTPQTTTAVGFNAIGVPCVSQTNCSIGSNGMVIYFTDTRAVGAPGWGAVTISPAGRIATWIWTGSSWSN